MTRRFHFVLASLVVSACGGSGEGEGDGGSGCGTADDPVVLTVADQQPEADSTVVNEAIVHSFTVVDAPGIFPTFALVAGPDHTAGVLAATLRVVGELDGDDLRYTIDPAEWSVAPGRVQFGFAGTYQGPDECVYEFPATVFDYEVVLPVFDGDAGTDGGSPDAATDIGGE